MIGTTCNIFCWKLFLLVFVYELTRERRNCDERKEGVFHVKQLQIFLLLALLLGGCGAQQADLTAGEEIRETMAQTCDGLSVTLEPVEEETAFLQGAAYGIYVNDSELPLLKLYVYETAEAAADDGACIGADGAQFQWKDGWGRMQYVEVEWVSEPHFFLYQNVIVQYIGTDRGILTALQEQCGQQIAGAPFVAEETWRSQRALDDPQLRLEVLPDTVSQKGLTVRLYNDSERELLYGESFSLLQKQTFIACGVAKADGEESGCEISTTWELVPMELFFKEIAYSLPAGGQAEQQIALPALEPGEYRMTKEILYQQEGQDDHAHFEVYADFVLPEKK